MHTTLIIDIHSDSVGAALVGIKPKVLPEILYSSRKNLAMRKDLSYKSLERSMLSTLHLALEDLFKKGIHVARTKGYPGDVHHSLITLSTPWTESKLINKWYKDEKPFAFDEELVKRIIQEEKAEWEKSARRPIEVFSSAVASLNINGYEAEYPSSIAVKEGRLGLILNSADKYIINQIESEVMKFFILRKGFHFQNFAYIFNRMAGEVLKTGSAMLVDFSSESTDVVAVKSNKILSVNSFVFGSGVLVRSIATEFDYPHELSRSVLNMFSHGVLDRKNINKLDGLMSACESLWQDHWRKIPEENLSKNIFILSSRNEYPFVRTLVESVMPGAEITPISSGSENALGISRHLVGGHTRNGDEALAMIASYSAFLL